MIQIRRRRYRCSECLPSMSHCHQKRHQPTSMAKCSPLRKNARRSEKLCRFNRTIESYAESFRRPKGILWNTPSASTRRSSLDVHIRRPDQRANELKESRQQAARYLKRTIRAAAQSSVSINTYHRHHASRNPSWPAAYEYHRVRWYIARSSVLENITFSSTLRPRQVSNTCHHIAFSMEAKAQSEMPIIAAMLSGRILNGAKLPGGQIHAKPKHQALFVVDTLWF